MRKKVLAISGSLKENSSNSNILKTISSWADTKFDVEMVTDLAQLPHFSPDLDNHQPPLIVANLRQKIASSDGVIFCTPEYVFSIPSALKNLIEWCVSTVIFTDKPTVIITASASGTKAHEQMQVLMQTLGANFTPKTTLLISGIKGKIDEAGNFTDPQLAVQIEELINSFSELIISENNLIRA
jgi:chromate reductase, NAD(P)H dehydrogenase (quinone)